MNYGYRKNGQKLNIHGWVYALNNGLIQDLNVTFNNDSQLNAAYKLEL